MKNSLRDFYKEIKRETKQMNSFTDNFDNFFDNYLQYMSEPKKKKEKIVITKKKKIVDPMDKYFFKCETMEENHFVYCNNLFYRLYFSSEQKYIDYFKKLKHFLKSFEVSFIHKKKEDEGYIIILNNFLQNLIINFYNTGDYKLAFTCFENSIDSNDFSLKINEDKFNEFMAVMDCIIDEYNEILVKNIKDLEEYSLIYDDEEKVNYELDNDFSDYSFTRPSKKLKKFEKMANIANEEELLKFQQQDKEENLEILNKKESSLIKTFHYKFGKDLLNQNVSYYDNLLVCFEYLENDFKTNDEIIEHLLAQLNQNFDAALFMIENRVLIVEELRIAREECIKKGPQKKNKNYATISQNLVISKKKKQKTQKEPQFNLDKDIFKILGIDEQIVEDTNKILKEKIKKKFVVENEIDDEYDFFQTDFFKETDESLQTKYGMKRKERLLNVVFDIEPKTKNMLYKQTEKLKVDEIFPNHIKKAFTDSANLNNLQSIIYDSIFNSDQNILCCAPTGAGKTNVALMSILRLADKNFDFTTNLVKDNFKIIYISPLKALATEIVKKFQSKLNFLGIRVKEFTGDTSLSKKELASTHIIVSTPEKWDVVTRKSENLNSMINLLIIDEIHLLDDERGRVLESLVARTVRLIEAKQCRIRLVGLSATLPNYKDVAHFLKVGKKGLFYFDESFRPVPLYKKFIGVKKIDKSMLNQKSLKEEYPEISKGLNQSDVINQNAFDICMDSLMRKKQVLIFVHSRKETIRYAEFLINKAYEKAQSDLFLTEKARPSKLSKRLENKDLKQIVLKGIGAHNAGIKRKDRHTIEEAFINGELSVVVCTATLAWGINMPCHTVIIKGTDFYEPGVGYRPMSLLDVQQIFGRAGRPQYDDYGEAVLITKVEDLSYFISMLNYIRPIESNFKPFLNEGLLAEIVLGNICSLFEAMEFIKATFFYERVLKNPVFYGFKNNNKEQFLSELIRQHLSELHHLRLIRYDEKNDIIEATELGRISSHYYVNCETMHKLCHYMNIYDDEDKYTESLDISEQNLIGIIAQATEFEQISGKPEEEAELNKLKKEFSWVTVEEHYQALYDKESQKEKAQAGFDSMDKVLLLIWGYLNRSNFETYSLVADTTYVVQNASRIMRCLLDVALKQNSCLIAEKIIVWLRYLENCVGPENTPLRMFCFDNYIKSLTAIRNQVHELKRFNYIPHNACNRIEIAMNYSDNGHIFSDMLALRENMHLLNDLNLGEHQLQMLTLGINAFPLLDVFYEAKPIAETIMQVILKIKPRFQFNKHWHQKKENFWVLCSDGKELIYSGNFSIDTYTANLSLLEDAPKSRKNNYIEHSFFVPLRMKSEVYDIRIMAERFVDADTFCEIDLRQIKLDNNRMEYTDLHDLRPLKVDIFQNKKFEKIFSKLNFFNPIQTQVFWPLYHTDENILIGAPTGSGKTVIAEIAILRLFLLSPFKKVIYIAPYKALVKERVKDWKNRFTKILGKNVNELSGDYTPDLESLIKSDILIATPEKWDGISRNWNTRSYVKEVGLIIFDEIHLLGQERGATIEVIVSRMNYISRMNKEKTRMIGLSTAIANSDDVGKWLGVNPNFVFNFRPSIRPVPVDIHFRGFSDKNYSIRMNAMNKPCYQDIKKFGNNLPVLIFVSSRKQTRLTALDLISLSSNDFVNNSPFMKMTASELEIVLQNIKDNNLKNILNFGIGIHHAGLSESDRMIVEELFEASKIQVLVATSTLAWGVNFPAKLVIIKGTVFYDPKTSSYVDMPISDILQMVGRAGRPQYNDKGTACVYVQKDKKNFYRKYLNDPFPIESAFLTQITEIINAEIASLSIKNKQHCVDYLTWTYFFRRIIRNPFYYGMDSKAPETVQKYLIALVDKTLEGLEELKCIELDEDKFMINPTQLGELACNYYLKCKTVLKLDGEIEKDQSIDKLIKLLSDVEEYKDIPVRHHESEMNIALADICPYKVNKSKADSPHVKTHLLLQAYFSNLPLPIRDYVSDTNTILDTSLRVVAAMIDLAAQKNFFRVCINLVQILQMIVQGCWIDHSCLKNLPFFNEEVISELKINGIRYLSELIFWYRNQGLKDIFRNLQSKKFSEKEIETINNNIGNIPDVEFDVKLYKFNSDDFKIEKLKYQFRGGEEAMLHINLYRKNFESSLEVKNKKLNKQKNFSWWIFVGNLSKDKIFAVKKCIFTKKSRKNIQIDIPLFNSPTDYDLDVILMSDSYIGLDQIQTINLKNYITPIYNK